MLSLEPPLWNLDGIALFRDHAVSTIFYHGAPGPEIAVSGGRPMFDIFAYAVDLKQSPIGGTIIPDELGAGFLTMGAACALSDQERSSVTARLADLTGLDPARISLYPIPYHKGSVQVIALDQMSAPATGPDGTVPPADPAQPAAGRPTFVEQIMGSATPDLMNDLRSVFSLALSQSGVTFLEGLYEDGAAPVGIVYDLAFYGLRPSVQARVTADVSTIYQHFGGTAGVQYYYVRAEVDAALDKLQQDGVIKVEITSEATGDEAQKSKDLAMSLFRDQIVQQLFRPTAPAVTPGLTQQQLGQALKQASGSILSLTLQYKRTEELKTVAYDFSERAPEERHHAPQAFLPLLTSRQALQQAIHPVALQNPFFETLDVLVTGPSSADFTALGIRQVEASLTYGEPADAVTPVSEALIFRQDATGDKHFGVPRAGRPSLGYSIAVAYDFDRTSDITGDAFRYELPPRRDTGRALLINPSADFGFLDVELELGRAPDGLAGATVTLSRAVATSGFTASGTFRLPAAPAAGPNPHWRVRTEEPGRAQYQVACSWRFTDDASYVQPAFSSADRLLVIESPFGHTRNLLVRPNITSAAVTEVTVDIQYADPAHDYARTFQLILDAPFTTQALSWPIIDLSAQKLRYRVTTTEPGFVGEGEWQETSEPSIVVGSAGSRVATIDIHLVGPALAGLGIDAVRLDLQVDPPVSGDGRQASLLLDDSSRVTTASLTYPPGIPLAYSYQTTTFKSDGTVGPSDWTPQSSNLLVISTRSL